MSKLVPRDLTFQDFLNMEVVRDGVGATITVDHKNGRPVRLLGFVTNVHLSDYQIFEQGFEYYQEMCDSIDDQRRG